MLFGDSMSDLCWVRIIALKTECSDCPNRMSIYRSCRKATLWCETPACNSASLPIVLQRASCIVGPLQCQRAHCLQEDLRRVIFCLDL